MRQFSTGFLLVAAMFFMVIFGAITLVQFLPHKATHPPLAASEAAFVERELMRRSASDCMLTRTDYGWRCEEIGTGKIFKVTAK